MILHTNAISDLSKKNQDLRRVIGNASQLYTTLISLGEYEFGILGSKHAKKLRTWLDALLQHVEVLQVNVETLPYYVGIRMELKKKASPIPANDIWIAALAQQYQLPVVSQDQHFDKVDSIKRIAW